MKILSLFILFLLAFVGALTFLNWETFIAPSTLSLGVADIHVPLGLVMIALLVVFTVLFLAFAMYLQGSALLQARRHEKALQTNRDLADKAEASRFSALQTQLETELKNLHGAGSDHKVELLNRLDTLDDKISTLLKQSENTLGAYFGELEDRLDKGSQARVISLPSEKDN